MKIHSFIFLVTLFFIFVVNLAYAVSFTPSVTPDGLNAEQTSQLLNFSVQNTGSINITQVNITLPPGFVFTGTSGTTTKSPYTSLSTTPSWTNSSAIGIVGNGATENFWIFVNTPTTTGSYGFNISTLDANGVFNSSNVSVSIFDTLAPTFTNNVTSPTTNSTYVTNQTYWFNVTWSDNVAISKVLMEHNLTGSLANATMSNESSVYYLKFTDLSAGTYVWRVYANDTNNTFNSTIQQTYIIRQATNELRVFLNGTLNNNITSINNTAVNITVNASCVQAGCNITVSRDGVTLVSGGPNPYSKPDDFITSIGLHNYSVSVSGNANYTSNSATYFVATTPSFTTQTSFPLTFSSATSYVNITFSDNPALANITIEGDWSGSATNYSMSNTTATLFFYSTNMPAGTLFWKIYGTYSNHTFNITARNSFTINKASPAITLSISPEWTLDSPVQTNVTCAISPSTLTVSLYRNGSSVSNPDVQTFTAGNIYAYLCNNTATQNYSTNTVTNTLTIRPKPTATLTFVEAPELIEITQNTNVSKEIKVKNTGAVTQNITFSILDIDKNWYSINQPTVNLISGLTATFVVNFNIGKFELKEYKGIYNVSSVNATASKSFTLKVLPSNETKLEINDTLALYKLELAKLESKFNELKPKLNETTEIEGKLNELKSLVTESENLINTNDYFSAYQKFATIKGLVNEVENKLKEAETVVKRIAIPKQIWWIFAGIVVTVVVGVLVYLFWPTKTGYRYETGYVWASEKTKFRLWESIKGVINKLFSKFKRKQAETEVTTS